MSLSSHLKDRTSPIGQFIKQRFAQSIRLTKSANQQLRSADTIRPVQADSSYQQLVAWEGDQLLTLKPFQSEVDLPVDWDDMVGIPLTLTLTALTTGVAQGPYPLALIRAFFHDLESTVNTIQPKGRLLEVDNERTLNSYCIVLSLFEQVYRSNAYVQGPLMQPKVKHTVEELLAIPQDSWS